MILEEGLVLGKDRTLLRLLDIGFQRHQAVFAGLVKQVVQHLQSGDISLLAELGTAKNSSNSARDLFQKVHGIRHQQGSHSGATDNEQFGRLHQDSEVAMLHQIARHHTSEDNDDADDRKHS